MTENTWKPDTCGCIIVFGFDADLPSEERVHTPVRCLKACRHHPDASDIKGHYNAVLGENQRKNRAFGEVADQLNDADKKALKWSIDEKREVVIELPPGVDKGTVVLTQEGSRLA